MMETAIAVAFSGISLDVFVVCALDNRIWATSRTLAGLFTPVFLGGWEGWKPLGGPEQFFSAPTAATRLVVSRDGEFTGVEVFGLSTNNEMLRISKVSGIWELQWSHMHGNFERTPSASSSSASLSTSSSIDLVGLGIDNCIYHTFWNGLAWKPGWERVLRLASCSPAVVSTNGFDVDIFSIGENNHMFVTSGSHAGTGAPPTFLRAPVDLRPGVFTSSVSAVAMGGNIPAFKVFALGTDNQVYVSDVQTGSGGGNSVWLGMGGTFNSPPVAVSNGTFVDVFAIGDDNRMHHNRLNKNGSWTGWAPLGDKLFNSAPAAVAWTSRVDVFALGFDNAVWTAGWDSSGPPPGHLAWDPVAGIANPSP